MGFDGLTGESSPFEDVVRCGGARCTELVNTWRVCSHHHALKTYFGWKVVGEPHNRDLVPPDDPDPPAPSGHLDERGAVAHTSVKSS